MSDPKPGNLCFLGETTGCSEDPVIDFSAIINPLGFPDSVPATIIRSLSDAACYPDPSYPSLTAALAERYGCSPAQVVPGRGVAEWIHTIALAMRATRALLPVPCDPGYRGACERAGIPIKTVLLEETSGFQLDERSISINLRAGDLVIIGRPNNPTGRVPSARAIADLSARFQGVTFVIDESLIEFSLEGSLIADSLPGNCIVVRSLTKAYAIPGMRLGAAVAGEEVAERLRRFLVPWPIDSIALRVGEQVLREREYARETREAVPRLRENLTEELMDIPQLKLYPSSANFILVRAETPSPAPHLFDRLLKGHRIALRCCNDFDGLDASYFRIAVRSEGDNRLLARALRSELHGGYSPAKRSKRPPATLMFQGTCSNAGKSVLAAALCRILQRQGVRVAPFKAQNMSLNSYVTPWGGEMGRAQALQAQACRIVPDCLMNPILLKPCSGTGSQIIVNGRPVGNMNVATFHTFRETAFSHVKAAYDELSSQFDAIVLEGAGSPAEVNLKRHDFVNMGMARYAQCPVLIAGDIDRGGVFASFVGTYALLDKGEQDLLRGFVINRFRGDVSQLSSAIHATRNYTGKPTLGVVPFIDDLGLPEEDSVSFKERVALSKKGTSDVDVAVIDLPHISNFTDVDPLAGEPDLLVRVVRKAEDLGEPDAVIIPGSKNTTADLQTLKGSGLADAIRNLASYSKTEVVGICGGFQMLGSNLEDEGVECCGRKSTTGLGLLSLSTTMKREKTLTQRQGQHLGSGLRVTGYEIHHGQSRSEGLPPLLRLPDGRTEGAQTEDGLIWGTYLHGIFDADAFRRWWIDKLRVRKGLRPLGQVKYVYDVDAALGRLADVVESCLDMETVWRLMGL